MLAILKVRLLDTSVYASTPELHEQLNAKLFAQLVVIEEK